MGRENVKLFLRGPIRTKECPRQSRGHCDVANPNRWRPHRGLSNIQNLAVRLGAPSIPNFGCTFKWFSRSHRLYQGTSCVITVCTFPRCPSFPLFGLANITPLGGTPFYLQSIVERYPGSAGGGVNIAKEEQVAFREDSA